MNKHVPLGRRAPVERTARLFRNGRSQAIRIPKEFEFAGTEVTLTKIGENRIVMEARKPRMSLEELRQWLIAQGPIDERLGDPGDEGLAPLDDVNL